MAVLEKFREAFGRNPSITEDSGNNVAMNTVEETKRDPIADEAVRGPEESEESVSEDASSTHLQTGVHDVEAITKSWSKWSLIAVFAKYVVSFGICISIISSLTLFLLLYQHLALILCKRFSVLYSLQSAPLCHQFLGVPLPPERHLCGCRLHVGRRVYPSGQNHGCDWPC